MKNHLLLCLLVLFLLSETGIAGNKASYILSGTKMVDSRGNVINAHGGGFLKQGEYYYWIGENRRNGVFVSCYRSSDLINWEFRGDLLTKNSHPQLDKANIERPKIIYNSTTRQFVMWMHYEYGGDYSFARAAVAVSPDLENPFRFIKSFRPLGNMSRDCTLYKDTDGTAYFFSSARENYDMIQYELTDDYLDIRTQIATLWPGGHREAPALFKRGDYYFMITSGCTGWAPNQAKYAFSKKITGPWSDLKDIGDKTTYKSQPTFVLPLDGNKTFSYIYVGDRWDGENYYNSTYVFLPLVFVNDSTPVLKWASAISPNLKSGKIKLKNIIDK